ncbi:hypothetical protein HanRHA438_Chr13g0584771 [Helianthus annuus]|nr:hypothetical protein HanHA300_Chr13g0470171 [Helianthus annuus]KAJ0479841.1 hypothetical protein HanIR_Chr13g0624691 [Helianthus annuus]KAJ0662675.1 hypothetical protein HanLR1_Chr13g0472381 [Helianthus annuus]KAJ0670183.1 hypothetical protein HanOQP8_Chr13g0471311 [Helianthus annuus]KAJ0848040.1 hypothetical protein HanPSC8_Chr13g0552491 [Helianthus annuus]
MGLKEALRLKSFYSTEHNIRTTRTPKGDPPYLTVVKENLYPIREPVAATGHGGSSSDPLAQVANVALVQTASMVSGDKGKRIGFSRPKDSGSKVVLYGSEHLSIEDDAEVHPQVSFKRGRSTFSKPDPNPKKLKKTKIDLKTVVLEDEVDKVTGFSAAGGLLENLDAHLHGGKTPRDQPVNLSPSPLSFGGQTTKVVDVTNMHDPLAYKKIDLSPSGKPTTGVASNVSRPSPQQIDGGDSSGEAMDVDSAQALERYVLDWLLVKKDRIVDALSVKMSLFHIGTPAEHAYYRKMSGPELGNALMLNQAQSNSLVVEAYKRWADRLREQVLEAKEVSKASQVLAAVAYEALDEVVHDLEGLKLKFEALEKKLSEVEERTNSEQKEMQPSYDQLLADHIHLVNGTFISLFTCLFFLASNPLFLDKAEIERARDKAVESHQVAIADVKDMLTRFDGEMIELYGIVSNLLHTKQLFLSEGIAWVVKLVHQSPELEREVADLVNSINAVGVNDGIKQVFMPQSLRLRLSVKSWDMMKALKTPWMPRSKILKISIFQFWTK